MKAQQHRDDGQCHEACWRRATAEFEAEQRRRSQHNIVPVGGYSVRDWCTVHKTYADLETR